MKTKFYLSFLTLIGLGLSGQTATAQTYQPSNRIPVADNTLGTQVSGAGGNSNITGGINKGQTLFHSFTDFSIPTNGQANFLNSAATRDIITRVTGGLFSDINGTLNSNGANFFLINPNGIVFGTNARLNVGKAFVGSTANSLDLVGGGRTITFGTNPNGDAPLLSVAPNVLFDVSRLNLGGGAGAISNLGTLQTTNPNQYIGLIGGNVDMNGGQINAPGGRVELGGLSAPGTITLGMNGNIPVAQFPASVVRGDVSLTNGARVSVAGGGDGDIAISARNLEVLSGSIVRGGIEAGLGTPQAVAGDIKINATGAIIISDANSLIINDVRLNSTGKGGNVTIDAGSFSLNNGAILEASTFGIGNAGDVTVTAKDAVSLAGNSYIFSTVEAGGVGKGGKIDINSGSLFLSSGAGLETFIRSASNTQSAGQGDAGNVTVNVSGAATLDGSGAFPSGIFSKVNPGSKGTGGNIAINAGSLSLTNGAVLNASTFGTGNAGNVTVTAKDAVSLVNGDIFSTVAAGGVGQGGNININAGSLSLKDGALLSTSTLSASDTQPAGRGDAGNTNVKVSGAIDIAGFSTVYSGIRSQAGVGTVGNGGNITIDSGSLSLRDGAEIVASTFGQGNAGNITVTAKDAVSLTQNSSVISSVETGGVGSGGNIAVNAGSLSIQDSADLTTVASGTGNAGNVTVKVSGAVDIAGSKDGFFNGIFSYVDTGVKGNGGDITVDAGSLLLRDGARLRASTYGTGNAGNVTVTAKDAVSLLNGDIFSTVESGGVGKGGSIDIKAGSLSLKDSAQLSTITRGASDTQPAGRGDAGNISVKVSGAVDIAGKKDTFPSGIRSTAGTGTVGNGGNITVDAGSFSLRDSANLIASTFGTGNAGNILLNSGKVLLNKGDIFSNSFSATGGNITIKNSDYLILRNNSSITTDSYSTAKNGNGGNITIDSPVIVATPENNDITANAIQGTGGRVKIVSQGLFGIQYRPKEQYSNLTNDITASSAFGREGAVNISTPGIDPGKDSTQLPTVPNDATDQISQVCGASNRENKLTVTGRGGLPPTANDPLTSDVIWQDARATRPQPVASNVKTNPAKLVAPAVGWVFDGSKVTLVAADTQGQPAGTNVVCPQTK